MPARGGNAFLERTHFISQGGLVAHRGRHAPEQGGYFRTGLGEAEDVIDEEQHVLVGDVAEVLRHRQAG